MAKTPFEKQLQNITALDPQGDLKLSRLLDQIKGHNYDEDFVDKKIDELIELKNDRAEFKRMLEDANLGQCLRAFYYSKKVEKLIAKESLRLGKKQNEVFWEIISKHFDIPVEECDPKFWSNKFESEQDN